MIVEMGAVDPRIWTIVHINLTVFADPSDHFGKIAAAEPEVGQPLYPSSHGNESRTSNISTSLTRR